MKVMDVLKRIKSGARIMVHQPGEHGSKMHYSLDDGTAVSGEQLANIKDFLAPLDPPLIPGEEPQSYSWAG